jgi:hypothetical protein
MRHRHRKSVEILEKCLNREALAIDRAGKRGAVYLPIYERIEAELDTLRANEEPMERARHDEALAWRDGNKPRGPRAAMESEIAVATPYEKGAQDAKPATARPNRGGHNYIDLMGHRFGKLAVLSDTGPRKTRRPIWLCRCDCGIEIEVLGKYLRNGDTRSCGCYSTGNAHNRDAAGDITLSFWTPRVKQVIRRGIPFEITRQQGWKLCLAKGGRCALTGVEIKFSPNIRDTRGAQTASLDRKDSRFGYTIGNIQWIRKKINIMKNMMNDTEFIRRCELIVQHHMMPTAVEAA